MYSCVYDNFDWQQVKPILLLNAFIAKKYFKTCGPSSGWSEEGAHPVCEKDENSAEHLTLDVVNRG